MIINLPPAAVFLIAAVAAPFFRGRVKKTIMVAAPLFALWMVHTAPAGDHFTLAFMGYDLVLARFDELNRVFGYIFTLIAFLGLVFAWHVDDDLQQSMSLVYAGSAVGVVFAGDFFSLYVFWEFMAVASTFLVLARRTNAARAAAFRYIMIHLAGGLVLLAGILTRLEEGGGLEVTFIGLKGLSGWLIFIGVAVNAAIFPLHAWLKDAYPQGTPTSSVFLSAFTTKSAIYLLARTFPGTELLLYLGGIMAVVPLLYAVLEPDIRGMLSYCLINQVGFMVCGVGLGTDLAINGAACHAFCHILYKALLFMAAGSVLTMTGSSRFEDLGGLHKSMPWTFAFYCLGALSISAPLFCGFVSKSMIISAAGHEHSAALWLALVFGSAGVFYVAGVKATYYIFFGRDGGLRPAEAPRNMLWGMGGVALLCLVVGVYPKPLYDALPYPVHYAPYTADHVVGQLQLLFFAAFAFVVLLFSGAAVKRPASLWDVDWFYRVGARRFYDFCDLHLNRLNAWADRNLARRAPAKLAEVAAEGPVRLVWLFARPVYALQGLNNEELARRRAETAKAMKARALPVGLSAAAAVLMLIAFWTII